MTSLLLRVSFVVRSGGFFVNLLVADVEIPQSAPASGVASTEHGHRVVLGPEFYGDLEV